MLVCHWRIHISTQMVCITTPEGKTSGYQQTELKSYFNENKSSFLLRNAHDLPGGGLGSKLLTL